MEIIPIYKISMKQNTIYFIAFLAITLFLICRRNIKHSHVEGFKLIATKGHNNVPHLVRNDFHNMEEAANLMAHLKQNMSTLVEHLNQYHDDHHGVKNLNKRLYLDNMMEAPHEDDSTSYTINKGEEMHICMREKNKNKVLHDVNTMMFVILHEMAHIMSDSIGHNNEFRENFIFLLKNAAQIDLYKKINYQKEPQSYCGLKINTTPIKTFNH